MIKTNPYKKPGLENRRYMFNIIYLCEFMRKNEIYGQAIPLSKIKLGLILLASLLFTAIGVWMALTADAQVDDSPALLKVLAVICIVFFGAASIFAVAKLFDDRPGLVVDSLGITDNSSGGAIGLIPWETITFIERIEMRQNFIAIGVKEPKKLIKKQNFLKRFLMSQNHRFFKTPIHISSNALEIDFYSLERLIQESWEKYKASRDS